MKKDALWKVFGLAAAVALALEGALVLAYASPVNIKGVGSIGETFVMLAGAQLFVLGLIHFGFWALKDSNMRIVRMARGWPLSIGALAASVVVMAEGLIVVLNAGAAEIGSIGGVLQRTVVVFGAQLFVLGAIGAVAWIERKAVFRLRNAFAYVTGIVVMGEGLVIVGVAAPTVIEGIGGILERTVALAGTQLLLLGAVLTVATLVAGKVKRARRALEFVVLTAAAVITIEGLVLTGGAVPVNIGGIGGIMKGTVVIAGVQLAALGLVALYSLNFRTVHTSRRLNKASFLAAVFLLLMVPMTLAVP